MRDVDIRRILRSEIRRLHRSEPDTLVVDELGLCQGIVRIDIAAINGSLHGYEIKSEQDTLSRLAVQSEIYSRVFDYVTIVVANAHLEKVRENVPDWWGISVAIHDGKEIRIVPKRRPRRNRNVDAFSVAQLLWRDEALCVLRRYGLAAGMNSKTRPQIWRRLANQLKPIELGIAVRDQIKQRGENWRELSLQA